MSMYRQYELSDFAGRRVIMTTKEQRRELMGKRVGFDLSRSVFAHYGTVTNERRGEIEVDGVWYSVSSIEQMVILTDQSGD